VYLLYADESGDLGDAKTRAFVVAAIAVHEDAVRPLAGEINGLMRGFVGRELADKLELHGRAMRMGAEGWDQVSPAKRMKLYHELLERLGTWEHAESGTKIEPFAVVMDRDHSQSPTETTYGELLYAFDEMLRSRRRRGDGHNGVLIADESRYEKTLKAWVEVARAYRNRPAQDTRRLHALAETPFFINSKETRLMQYADLLAHGLFRGYNAGDWALANTAASGLEGDDPVRLVHFTPDAQCTCLACETAKRTTA
jgi:hypothetical protein